VFGLSLGNAKLFGALELEHGTFQLPVPSAGLNAHLAQTLQELIIADNLNHG